MFIRITKATPIDMIFGIEVGKEKKVDAMFIGVNSEKYEPHFIILINGKAPYPVHLDQAEIIKGDIDDLPDEKLFLDDESMAKYINSFETSAFSEMK